MQIYPAIDLRNNQCVRLLQGQFAQMTIYSADPLAIAQQYATQGATWLHMVDLDGAQQNGHNHWHIAQQIQQQTPLNIQFGGGIRNEQHINDLLTMGIKRIVIGSMAIQQPHTVKQWLRKFGAEQLVIALDVFWQNDADPLIAIQGWQQKTNFTLWQLLEDYQDSGLKHILCTDISRDGLLQGPNLALYQQCQQNYPDYALQASGGISSLTDLKQLQSTKVAGVIIGKALYEQRFTVQDALQETTTC